MIYNEDFGDLYILMRVRAYLEANLCPIMVKISSNASKLSIFSTTTKMLKMTNLTIYYIIYGNY